VSLGRSQAPPQEASPRGRWLRLEVADDGVGLPAGLDFRKTESLGLKIVCTLTEQLGGGIQLDRSGGARFTVLFPEA
jgi:two-component sensor histidine kinase